MSMFEYQQLSISLDKLLQLYRQLLSILQREESILVSSNLESLKESNKSKEKVVQKISDIDLEISRLSRAISKSIGISEMKPSLSLLAKQTEDLDWKAKLENYHRVFEMLIKDLTASNKKNAALIEAAQLHVQGAMDSIKETIVEPTNYENSGKVDEKNKKAAGSFINREV